MPRRIEIAKGAGRGVRVIYACSPAESREYRAHLPALQAAALLAAPRAYGCVPGRSPTSAAREHAAREWSLCADLREMFDRCSRSQIEAGLALAGEDPQTPQWRAILDAILIQGAPRQGLPTSPAAANLALAPLDTAIVAWLAERDPRAVYTRYVDDLTVSSDSREVLDALRAALPALVTEHAPGHEVHARKWSLQSARAGRRVICGVALDGAGAPHATRSARRRLRAAEHARAHAATRAERRAAARQARGLAEWARQRPSTGHAAALDAARATQTQHGSVAGPSAHPSQHGAPGSGEAGVSPGSSSMLPHSVVVPRVGDLDPGHPEGDPGRVSVCNPPHSPVLVEARSVVRLSQLYRGQYTVSSAQIAEAVRTIADGDSVRVDAQRPGYGWRIAVERVWLHRLGGHIVLWRSRFTASAITPEDYSSLARRLWDWRAEWRRELAAASAHVLRLAGIAEPAAEAIVAALDARSLAEVV